MHDGAHAQQVGAAASARRIGAMVRRHWFVIRSSGPRVLELIFWPLVSMLMWGFLQTHLATTSGLAASTAGLFVAGVLLWDILVRSQLGFSVAFLEELWSRNLGHLMMSPLRPSELVASLVVVSLIKMSVAMVPVAVLAYALFGFNLLSLGIAFAAFFCNLVIMSWSLALISTGAALRWGMGAESLAWLIVFVLLPISCVYYPVGTLPGWIQPLALAVPATNVFEGLRALLLDGRFASDLMLRAFGLNVVLFAVSYGLFRHLLESARRNGSLVQMGE
ncbi:MAG: ABC transporter permease [Hyphomicrobiaceae bacterium]